MSDTEIFDEEDVPPLRGFSGWKTFIKAEGRALCFLVREFTTPMTRYFAVLTFVGTIAMVVCSTTAPLFVGNAINGLIGNDADAVMLSIAAVLGIMLLQQLLSMATGAARERVLGFNHCRMDERVTELFMEKSLGQHERHSSRLNHASIDKAYWRLMSLQDALIWVVMPCFIRIVLALGGLMYVSPMIGLAGVGMTCLFIAWMLYLNYRVGQETHPLETEFRRLNRLRVERWEKIFRVKTNGKARDEQEHLSTEKHSLMWKDVAFWCWFIRQADTRNFVIQRLFYVGVLSYGAYLVYAGEWSLGILFPLLVWTDMLVNAQLELSSAERRISQDMIVIQMMIETLTLPPAFASDAELIDPPRHLVRNGPLTVELCDVSFSYTDEARGKALRPVLRDINLRIGKGEKVALVGPSGSGKTTLMKLLLRYYDPTEGSVLIGNPPNMGGWPLPELDLTSYLRLVGYIPQRAEIFDGTMEDNLLYGASPEERERLLANDGKELWTLMRSLKIDFGTRLTHGLKTKLGRHGVDLSGGQQQRVMIGAAVAKQPRLMVIDEATSSLDSTTEREVQEGLALALKSGITALIVAHRLSTVRNLCDRFVVLRPIESLKAGECQIEAIAHSFEELYKVSPTFKQLADDQGVVC